MTQGTTEKTCTRCGRIFTSGTNQVCNPCRAIDRNCITCGKTFRGRVRKCYDCRASDRPCKICGVIFHGINKTCTRCINGKTGCQMPRCEEPKLRGRGAKYCAQHSADAVKGSPAYREHSSIMQVRRQREQRLGVTHDKYTALLEEQAGVCAICGHDSIAILEAAIEYLKRNQVLIPPHCV